MNLFGLSFVLFMLKWSAGKGFTAVLLPGVTMIDFE